MSGTKLARRLAAQIMRRGESSIRMRTADLADIGKALTRDDVKALIQKGAIYALKPKRNVSSYGKVLKQKRGEGRKRGKGRRKGTSKARRGYSYVQMIRAQRRVLKSLKSDGTINNEMFKKYYRLSKGGVFNSKLALITRIKNEVQISDERLKQLRGI